MQNIQDWPRQNAELPASIALNALASGSLFQPFEAWPEHRPSTAITVLWDLPSRHMDGECGLPIGVRELLRLSISNDGMDDVEATMHAGDAEFDAQGG